MLAEFENRDGYTVTHLYQWDINQKLKVYLRGIATPPQFHFCNIKDNETIVCESKKVSESVFECDIPNKLLQTGLDIIAYIYYLEDEKQSTVEQIQIQVIRRAKPSDYVDESNADEILKYSTLASKLQEVQEVQAELSKRTPLTIEQVKKITGGN